MPRPRARKGSPLYLTPAFELLPDSYAIVKAHFRIFALLYLFPLIVGLSNGFWVVDSQRHLIPDTLDAANAAAVSALPAYTYGRLGIFFVIALVIGVTLRIMIQAAQLKAVEGHKPNLNALWQTAKQRWMQFFQLYLAVSVITFIWIIPAIYFRTIGVEILCFIPVAYFLMRYLVAPYVLLEHPQMNFGQAMSESARLTGRSPRSAYSVVGVLLLFALFGIVAFIGWIAAFALIFFYTTAPALRYRELKRLG